MFLLGILLFTQLSEVHILILLYLFYLGNIFLSSAMCYMRYILVLFTFNHKLLLRQCQNHFMPELF